MIEEIKTHSWHYLILVVLLLTGVVAFLAFPERDIKFEVGFLMAITYAIWGIFHHLLEDNLNIRVVIEYILVGILAIALLEGVIL
jgi:hypothetical protein